MTTIKDRAAFAEHAAPEAVAAHLAKARQAAARAASEVRWLEDLLQKKTGRPLCPRCGLGAADDPGDVCTRCAAQMGWDPPCKACRTEGAGHDAGVIAHVDTCAGGRKGAAR